MQGVLTVISGFSGAGKGTVVKELLEKYDYGVSISATTRAPREGEVDGKSYFFKTKEEFEKMIQEDQLIEYAQYVGNYYGTPKDYVLQQLEKGTDVILEIEMQGGMHVKEIFPDAALIFLAPPSVEELRTRLVNRGTETQEVIEKRMARAREECAYMPLYDYVVVNDDLSACVEQVHSLIQSLHCRKQNKLDFINKIKEDFEKI